MIKMIGLKYVKIMFNKQKIKKKKWIYQKMNKNITHLILMNLKNNNNNIN